MIPIGEPCKVCKKIHVIKSDEVWDSLSVKEKTKAYKTEHRIFRDGYWRSYEVGNEIWEFYLPLTVHKTLIVEEAMEEKPERGAWKNLMKISR